MTSKQSSNEQESGESPESHEYEVAFPQLSHKWRQRGEEVYCTACFHRHGFYVEPDTKMVGEENGLPVFERC